MEIVHVAPVRDTFVCCVVVVEIDHDSAVFRFGERFGVFASKVTFEMVHRSTWEMVGCFEQLAIDDDSVVWLVCFNSFKGFAVVDVTKLPGLFFCCATYMCTIDKFVDSL